MAVRPRVLLIDDDADFVAMNEAVLEANGYDVEVAYNGEEGLGKALTGKPDLIILDVMMDTPSEGFDLARSLREHQATRDTPLVMVTSVNDTVPFKFEPDGRWLPVDELIEKPVAPERLLEAVEERLHNARTARPTETQPNPRDDWSWAF